MRTVPATEWYLLRTLGSGKEDKLQLSGHWRLASAEGLGSPPLERSGLRAHEIDGQVFSTYSTQIRPLVLGVFYKGAKNQREYWRARQRLLDYVRPNQHIPIQLHITLPTYQKFYIEVYGSPGAPLPLSQDRRRTILEPVNFEADDPIWKEVERNTVQVDFGTFVAPAVPGQATIVVDTGSNAVLHNQIRVNLGTS